MSTYNILLDDNYRVKLNGVNLDRNTSYKTGYTDRKWGVFPRTKPTYDVYGFGVILLELISGNKVFLDEYGVHGWGTSGMFLGRWGFKMIKKNELDVLVDKKLEYHSNLETKKMVTSVAELACRCVQRKRKMRPTMSEVLLALKQIKDGSKKTETTPISNL